MSPPSSIAFTQYLLPPLMSGATKLTATQTIAAPGGQGEAFQAVQSLFVKGARYQLDDSAVDSVFPPPGNQGEFSNLLPHVVLTQPTLPWQRSPAVDSPSGKPPAGAPTPTWLALLLFDETDPPPPPQHKTLADLSSTAPVFSAPRMSEMGENPTDPVTFIDIPAAQFAALAPALPDLQWTSHVRQITTMSAKAAAPGAVPAPDYAVVFGTRLPVPGRVSTVHLVSLEGFGPYLPSAEGTASTQIPPGTTTIRLVTLRSWSFSTIAFNQTFAGILLAVGLDPAGLQLPFRPGPSPGDATVGNAFGLGYTALDHSLRNGSSTVSWYRGPLLPLGSRQVPFARTEAADQLLRYDPENGMFDVSYAAAWELGRMLGLHDRAYATALYRWKLGLTQRQADDLEQQLIDAALPPIPAPGPGGTVVSALKQVLPAALAAVSTIGQVPPDPPRATLPQAVPGPRVEREALAEALGAPRVHAPSDPAAGTDEHEVISWLTQLHLLQGVPFNYLVPDIQMLPAESIRFFQVDYGWVQALLDGAFSLGTTRAAAGATTALREPAITSARGRLRAVRRALLGQDRGRSQSPEALSGFLLRSAAVAGWPGMEVHGFSDTTAQNPLDLVRLERVAPTLLLCLFGGILARVDLVEPPEGLHFGVDFTGSTPPWRKQLRYADGDDIGVAIQGAEATVTIRPTDPKALADLTGVIEVDALAQAMAPQVWSGSPGQFTAAEFALEMVEGGEAVSFQVNS